MRPVLPILLALFALPLAAANIRFDPPNPTSRTPVTAHVYVVSCGVESTSVTRSGNIISITINSYGGCIPEVYGRHDAAVDLGVLPPGLYEVVAGPGNLLVAIAEARLPVRDATPAFRIDPNVVSVSGGTVYLSGTNIGTCSVVEPASQSCRAIVKFGDVAVNAAGPNPDQLTVVAPPHGPGIVDVTVQSEGITSLATAAFDYFEPGAAPDPAFFERILFPVLYSGAGSFGSIWRTAAVIHNRNAYSIDQPREALFVDGICAVNTLICQDSRPKPDQTLAAPGRGLSTGFVLYVPRAAAPRLDFNLMVRDVSRDATDFGTSVPVVREREFLDEPFSLVNIPSDARYRLGLRLYAYEAVPTAFRLRIFSPSHGVFVERTVYLAPERDHAFAFIADLLAEHPQLVGKLNLQIDVRPTEPGTLAWGYVSITNNETQHVTVIAPE